VTILPFAFLYPMWLIGVVLSLDIDTVDSRYVTGVAVLWLPAILVISGRIRWRHMELLKRDAATRNAWIVFFVASLIGCLMSIKPLESLAYLASLAVALALSTSAWSYGSSRVLGALRNYAVFGTLLAVVVVGISGWDFAEGDRLGTYRNPNAFAVLILGLLISVLAIKAPLMRWGLLTVNLGLLALTGSRASLVAAVVAIGCIGFFWWRETRGLAKMYLVTVIVFLGGATALLLGAELLAGVNDVLALDDPYRGLGSGFTGRTFAWQRALEIWREHPVFGIGYRLQELYYEDYAVEWLDISSAHSGYLGMLMETGFLGAGAVLVILFRRGRSLFRAALQGDATAQLASAFMAGYLSVAFFERFMFNVGNPTSLLFLLIISAPLIQRKTIRGTLPLSTTSLDLSSSH
jgi:O-antigen ligase